MNTMDLCKIQIEFAICINRPPDASKPVQNRGIVCQKHCLYDEQSPTRKTSCDLHVNGDRFRCREVGLSVTLIVKA